MVLYYVNYPPVSGPRCRWNRVHVPPPLPRHHLRYCDNRSNLPFCIKRITLCLLKVPFLMFKSSFVRTRKHSNTRIDGKECTKDRSNVVACPSNQSRMSHNPLVLIPRCRLPLFLHFWSGFIDEHRNRMRKIFLTHFFTQ